MEMVLFNNNLLCQGSIFRGYVSFREGISQTPGVCFCGQQLLGNEVWINRPFGNSTRPSVASAESNDDLIALLKLVISAVGLCFMLNLFLTLQGGPLPVISRVITTINGLINLGTGV